MKRTISITGASNWVNKMFLFCGQFQWAREFLMNSIEAKAKRVEFGVERQAVEKLGVYRRFVADDGLGMSADELWNFFSTLGAGSKKIGGIHDNFGIGSKVSSLPWNPNGLVVISKKSGKMSMIHILLNRETDEFEFREFDTEEDGKSNVIDPTAVEWLENEVDFGTVMPEWIKDHGTMVILFGSDKYPDTVRGNPGAREDNTNALSQYLNTRFFDLKGMNVKVVEFDSKDKSKWTESEHTRNIQGAKHYLETIRVKNGTGRLASTGSVNLYDGRLKIRYYLWEGDRPNGIHSYARRYGYIATKYGDELYEVSLKKTDYRSFGIVDSVLQDRITIILEPQLFRDGENEWGIYPDHSRGRLSFTNGAEKAVGLPLSDWGLEFSKNLPEDIRNAILTSRSKIAASMNNEEYRKRLQDKFGNRWKAPFFIEAAKDVADAEPATPEDGPVTGGIRQKRSGQSIKKKQPVAAGSSKPRVLKKKRVFPDRHGATFGIPKESYADIPKYVWKGKEEFEKPYHLALWAPNDPEGPTVLLNRDSEIIEEQIRHFQDQYPPAMAEDVQNVVLEAYGEIATCKIAHSQKLKKLISKEQLDEEYRTEAALTMSLLGLIAEEHVIWRKLQDIGKRLMLIQHE